MGELKFIKKKILKQNKINCLGSLLLYFKNMQKREEVYEV
jgi:hypothetical protein